MAKNGCRKGKVGERELAALFRECGFDAKRGVQHKGGAESPDVVTSIAELHVECKRVESLQLYPALEQAERDAGLSKMPVVFHRRNKKPWVAILHATEFLALLKKAGYGVEECSK